ncbi:hypothetical protein CS8_060830 [Cupriavidus sp. 8B]
MMGALFSYAVLASAGSSSWMDGRFTRPISSSNAATCGSSGADGMPGKAGAGWAGAAVKAGGTADMDSQNQ